MEGLWKDVRFAVRSLAKSRAVTGLAIVALALGIGATTTIFSVANGVLIEPLPYPDPDRLIRLIDSNPTLGFPRFATSPPDFRDWREQSRSFESLVTSTRASLNLTGDREPERIDAAAVSAGFFETLGLPLLAGRGFSPAEDQPNGPKAVVLSEGLWTRRFGRDPGIVGRAITLDGAPHTVVGIAPAAVDIPTKSEAWVPLALEITEDQRGGHWLSTLGRLKPGVTLEQAQAEMSGIAARLAAQYPATNTGWGLQLVRLKDLMVEDIRPALRALLWAVAAVLLIACLNVANLLLVRLASREREVAVRTALGAGRGRLLRQFLTESVLLSLAGGGLGLLLAAWGTRALVAINADNIPRAREIGVDGRVLLFTFGLSVATGLLFGLLPALQAARADLSRPLKEGGRGIAGGVGGRLTSLLVLVEVAVALVLLVGAGLLLKSFSQLGSVPPGFDPRGVMTLNLQLPESTYAEEEAQARFFRELLPKISALPGVEHAGTGFPLPLSGGGFFLAFLVDGRPAPEPAAVPSSGIRMVSPGYLEAMSIPLVRGRTITAADDQGAERVVLVNQKLAASIFAGEEVLGKRITFGDPAAEDPKWRTIVGIVGDVRHAELDEEPGNETYVPVLQMPQPRTTIVARTAGDPGALSGPLRAAVQELDPSLPVFKVQTLEQVVAGSLAEPRLNTVLLAAFSLLALVLAAVGVYGVISYSVAQRTHEMGLRMALGASMRDVRKLVLGQGMRVVLAGVVMGLALAFLATKLLASLLYGVSSRDPLTFVLVPLVLAAVALVASWVPARRATRVDPVVALKYE